MDELRRRAAPLDAFALDPAIVHLNHGSFGACPRLVLEAQARWRARLEAATMRFFVLEYQAALDAARARLADFLGLPDDRNLAFVPNASTGVATVLDALIGPGDDVVTTDHAYAACRNALDRVVAARGGRVITAHLEVPVRDPAQHVAAIVAAVTPRTRLVLLDQVTSPTGLVLDAAAIAQALPEVELVIDGAHAPGMLPLELAALSGVAAYVGNLHKWVCAPKGAGFLWVHERHRERVRPLVTSHGRGFRDAFDWTGTHDPTAALCVPDAIDAVAHLAGGWPAFRDRAHRLALAMRDTLLAGLGGAPLAPASMIGTMASIAITLPAGVEPRALERGLLEAGWEVAIAPWSRLDAVYLRVSAHLYNELGEVERLVDVLRDLGVQG